MEESAKLMDAWIADGTNLSAKQVVNISIYWHMIKHRGKKGVLSDRIIDQSIDVLNKAFAPYFTFSLMSVDIIDNKGWSKLDKDNEYEMKKALRIGDCSALNIYSSELSKRKGGVQVFGWGSFPHNCADNVDSDGIVIDYRVAPEGKIQP